MHPCSLYRKPAVINLDTYTYKSKSGSKKKTKASQPWLPTLNLHISEQDILLSPTAWITDTIVNAAQHLLKKQFPSISGLQDVALGLVMNFNIQTGEFVQILHTAEGHWLAISTLGLHHPDVNVYDSVYLTLPTLAKAQIASLLNTKETKINVHIMKLHMQVLLIVKLLMIFMHSLCMHMQSGSCDCGLFAIAYITELAHGNDPRHVVFEQHKMRKHLYTCFKRGHLSSFPHKKMVSQFYYHNL